MSLEDLIKKDRSHKKFSGNGKFQGGRGGFKRGGFQGGNQGGNVVPRFRNQAGGIFKKRQGGNFGGQATGGAIELPPRSGQRQAGDQQADGGVQARRIKRVSSKCA